MTQKQSFYDWLLRETASVRFALIALYENRDRLLYLEAPELRRRYLSIFGETESAVLREELETALLRRKAELIQTALNRRERVDPARIEELLEEERKRLLSELEQNDATLDELPRLSDAQRRELRRMYLDITHAFHPAINTALTETQKELYKKALDAFRAQDVEALNIIHDCLFDRDAPLPELREVEPEERDARADFCAAAAYLATDYSLAKELYPLFSPLEEDRIMSFILRDCKEKKDAVEEEIGRIRSAFPFNALETMNDPAKAEEYRAELKLRALRCEEEQKELRERIRGLTEGERNG